MENQNCYIEFEIKDYEKFNFLKQTFELFKTAKINGEPQSDQFWINMFPKYVLEKFYFLETDIKPDFETSKNGEYNWHFYSLIELLETNYEIEYVSCVEIEKNKGKIEYNPYSYPYGGIDGLVTFINSFECKPLIIDDGTSLYEIDFLESGDFSITDLEDSEKQNSSSKLFDANNLLRKFVNRLKQ
jgi:hypothetical protein